jgi:hypothetical protein
MTPRLTALMILMACVGGPWCLAQEQPDQPSAPAKKDPKSDPGLSDPSLEDEITGHRKGGPPPAAIAPTPPKPAQRAVPPIAAPVMDAPGLSNVDFSLPSKRFYPEGALLPARKGQVLRARTGEMIFVPDKGDGAPEPAMVLLGCQRLSQLEAAAAAPGFTGSVTLGGQVFVYRDRHYLLPGVFSTQTEAREDQKAKEPKEPKQPKEPSKDPRAEDLIKELETQRGAPRALDPAMRKGAPVTPAPSTGGKEARPVLTEGTALVMRRGRLVRLPGDDGRFAFAFDNDLNSPAPAPMALLACGELQQLEMLATTRGEDVVYKISGRVMSYQGRNYLLPVMHQVVETGAIVPMQ